MQANLGRVLNNNYNLILISDTNDQRPSGPQFGKEYKYSIAKYTQHELTQHTLAAVRCALPDVIVGNKSVELLFSKIPNSPLEFRGQEKNGCDFTGACA